MSIQQTTRILFLAIVVVYLAGGYSQITADEAETKAIAFLLREVPAWPKKQRIFFLSQQRRRSSGIVRRNSRLRSSAGESS